MLDQMTNERMDARLVPNMNLKKLIRDWAAANHYDLSPGVHNMDCPQHQWP